MHGPVPRQRAYRTSLAAEEDPCRPPDELHVPGQAQLAVVEAGRADYRTAARRADFRRRWRRRRDGARLFGWWLRPWSGCERNSAHFHWLRLREGSLGRNRRCATTAGGGGGGGTEIVGAGFSRTTGSRTGAVRTCRRSCGPRLLSGNFHRGNGSRRWSTLRSVSCLSPASALQCLQLPGKVGNSVVEFGGFTTATVVGNQRSQ